MAYVLGADFGGGSCKITLLDDQGNARASFSEEYPSYFPHPMWVEQDPDEIFRAFSNCLSRLWSEVPGAASEIKAIALDGGTHIAVLLDGGGRVIRPAIYWQDSRSTKESEEAEEAMGDALRERTFNIPSSTWTLPQLMWLQKHERGSCRRIRKILFLKDYLRHRLTGDEVTDSIDAMGSLLLDADKESWDSGFVSLAGLDESVLPDLRDPFDIAGTVTREAAAETGLKEGTPVAVGSTDTVMEMFASGAVVQGDATVKLATAGRVCIISDHAVVDKALVTYRHIIKGMWYPGTAVKTAASSLRWFRDSLSSGRSYREIDEAAATIPIGSEGMFFHPYLQGEITPYLDNSLRAGFTGISMGATYAHFARSVLEGVAFALTQSLGVLRDLGLVPSSTIRAIGGGSRSRFWLQILSDVMGEPLIKIRTDDSSIGSAMLAGSACGMFSSPEDAVARVVKKGDEVHPSEENHRIYSELLEKYIHIADAMQRLYRELEGI